LLGRALSGHQDAARSKAGHTIPADLTALLNESRGCPSRDSAFTAPLSTQFNQTTGVTFHHFLEEVRLSKARELLRDPRNRVGEVADAAGYASPDSFRHAFKAHEGLSPDAWRAGQ